MLPHELPKKVQVLAAEAFLKVRLPAQVPCVCLRASALASRDLHAACVSRAHTLTPKP